MHPRDPSTRPDEPPTQATREAILEREERIDRIDAKMEALLAWIEQIEDEGLRGGLPRIGI